MEYFFTYIHNKLKAKLLYPSRTTQKDKSRKPEHLFCSVWVSNYHFSWSFLSKSHLMSILGRIQSSFVCFLQPLLFAQPSLNSAIILSWVTSMLTCSVIATLTPSTFVISWMSYHSNLSTRGQLIILSL